jgi:hypothetical protein
LLSIVSEMREEGGGRRKGRERDGRWEGGMREEGEYVLPNQLRLPPPLRTLQTSPPPLSLSLLSRRVSPAGVVPDDSAAPKCVLVQGVERVGATRTHDTRRVLRPPSSSSGAGEMEEEEEDDLILVSSIPINTTYI